jgi:hypothetical protein
MNPSYAIMHHTWRLPINSSVKDDEEMGQKDLRLKKCQVFPF